MDIFGASIFCLMFKLMFMVMDCTIAISESFEKYISLTNLKNKTQSQNYLHTK